MDWLSNIVSILPMDKLSDIANRLTIWWSQLVADVPPDMLPLYAYVGFSLIVLFLWLFIVRVLPSPIGGISWLAVFSILMTPSTAIGDSSDIAPASIATIYGIIMQKPDIVLSNLLPIIVVFTVGLLLGFIWQLIRNAIESNSEKVRSQAIADEKATAQLASANYMAWRSEDNLNDELTEAQNGERKRELVSKEMSHQETLKQEPLKQKTLREEDDWVNPTEEKSSNKIKNPFSKKK